MKSTRRSLQQATVLTPIPEEGPPADVDAVDYQNQPIGEILRSSGKLTSEQVEAILEYQVARGLRFGEAAIKRGLVKREDVLWALALQFRYPYRAAESVGEHNTELFMANEPFSDEVESFRELRSHLVMTVMAPQERKPALAIVSADVGDGKTFLAANLATAFSQLPGRTLIIDCDMRSPRLHELFGHDNASGLSNILSGRAVPNVIRPVNDLTNLYMLPVGTIPPNPLELLQQPAFGRLLREMTSKFDYVLVDTPAAAHGADARMIAIRAGAALFVGRRNRTHTKTAQKLMSQLTRASVQIAGVVLNEG